MDDKTLTALKQSIEKWDRNTVAETPDDYALGTRNCPLCEMFWRRECIGCPVRDRTNRSGCRGTPYDRTVSARMRWIDSPSDATLREKAHDAARDEVAFLRCLLPEANYDKATTCGLPCGYDCNGACLSST